MKHMKQEFKKTLYEIQNHWCNSTENTSMTLDKDQLEDILDYFEEELESINRDAKANPGKYCELI